MASVAAMEAAADDVKPADFFDIDSFNLDDFDFDLAADEFCDAYAAFVADADNKSGAGAAAPGGWLASPGSSEGSSSRESGVTDGPLAGEGSTSMSAFVSELERFLFDNDDVFDDAAACPEGEEGAEELTLSVDDYFGDLPVAFEDGGVASVEDAAAGNNADGESLAAREEDEPTSRKRARHKIRGTTMTTLCSWGELEVTRRHLAPMQVPVFWLPAAAPALLCE